MSRRIVISETLYYSGLIMLVAGLPVSLFLTSLSQFVLLASFLLAGTVDKLKRFYQKKAAVLLAGVWLMHLIGLAWTEDIGQGINDVRIKLPLLLLPVIIAGSRPLTAIRFRWLLLAFVGAVFCGTMVSMAVLVGIIHRNVYDIRDVFIFNISHIRFALFTCLSVFILAWISFIELKGSGLIKKLPAMLFMAWFIVFLVIVESVTGLVILSCVSITLLFYLAFTARKMKHRIVFGSIAVFLPLFFFLSIGKMVKDFYVSHPYTINISDKTKLGNDYSFNTEDPLYENGYPVWVYVCDKELTEGWNNLSRIHIDSVDERNQPIFGTLVRFMASKGLRKDAEGLSKLSRDEIRSIEKGIANVNYQEVSDLHSRLIQIMWEIDMFMKGSSSNAHSVTQRFEFWRAGWGIASSHLLSGVGTGDLPGEYAKAYARMNSSLDKQHRLRTHNQFLAITVAFGIPGLIYFLIAVFYPLISFGRKTGFLFSCYFLITLFSMLSEDTLETQAGSTFVAFFFVALFFARPEKALINSAE